MKPPKKLLQALSANQKPERRTPAAPAPYRPLPIPKVLQTKRANVNSVVGASNAIGNALAVQLRANTVAGSDLRAPTARPTLRDSHNRQLSEQHRERVAQQQLIRVVRPHVAGVGTRNSEAAAVLLKRAPGVVRPLGFATRNHNLRHASVLQLAEAAEVPIKCGLEDEVNWYWVNNLTIKVSNQSAAVEVGPHPVHSKPVNGMNQVFYGGYTIVHFHGGGACSEVRGPWFPTKTEHTEPQFFAWLKEATDNEPILKEAHTDVVCVIIEINQTYTPCSKGTCRKEILSWVRSKKWGSAYCVARMSAFDLYSHQYPTVQITSMDAKKIRSGSAVVTLSGPAAVHKVPENYLTY